MFYLPSTNRVLTIYNTYYLQLQITYKLLKVKIKEVLITTGHRSTGFNATTGSI